MADIGNTSVISPTDASNGSGTHPSWLGSAAPATLDDAGRALQGAIAREWQNRSFTVTSSGTAPTFVIAYTVAPAAYRTGQVYSFIAHAAAAGTETANINSLGAKNIKKLVAGAKTATAANDWLTGEFLMLAYDGTDLVVVNRSGDMVSLGAANAFTGANTHASTETFNSTVTIAKELALTGDITPTQILANQNDYAPTGHSTASVMRLSSDAYRVITSLAGGTDGRIVVLCNVGSFQIDLEDQSASGTAANRFITMSADWATLDPDGTLILIYDATSSRWRVISPPKVASVANMEAGSEALKYVAPVIQHRHPGHPKFWAYVTVSAGTPTLSTSYNVTSITDTGPGLLTVTIATDFSAATWNCQVAVERAATALAVANLRYAAIRNAGLAAGTVLVECWDGTAVTALQVDPASWHVTGLGDHA